MLLWTQYRRPWIMMHLRWLSWSFWVIDGCSYFSIDNTLITYIAFDLIGIGNYLCVIYFNAGVAFAIDTAHSNSYYSAEIANSFAIMIAEQRTVLQKIGNCFAWWGDMVKTGYCEAFTMASHFWWTQDLDEQYIQFYRGMQ